MEKHGEQQTAKQKQEEASSNIERGTHIQDTLRNTNDEKETKINIKKQKNRRKHQETKRSNKHQTETN